MTNKIIVKYPDETFTKPPYSNSYYLNLRRGFEALDYVDFQLSKKLTDESHKLKIESGWITVIEIVIDGKSTKVYYDWSDFHRFCRPELAANNLYYKVECSKIQTYRFGFRPIGNGITNCDVFSNNLDRLRAIKNKKEYEYDVVALFCATSPAPGHKSIRIDAVEKIDKMGLNSLIGCIPRSYRPKPPEWMTKQKKIDYISYLEAIAKSKIVILMPGMGETSWRIGEAFGVGCACIMPEIGTVLPGNSHFAYANCFRNLSNFEKIIEYFLDDDNKREELASRAREYYDNYYCTKAQAESIINDVKELVKCQ